MALEWSAETLRLTLFSSEALKFSDADWLNLTGQETSDLRQAIPGGWLYAGKVGELQIQASVTGSRLDVIATQPPPKEVTEPRFNTVGPWNSARDTFVAMCLGWLPSLPSNFNRVAFGTTLLYPTNSHLETLTALKGLLKSVHIDVDSMREPTFRVNWPLLSSTVTGLEINRITVWTGLQATIQLIQVITTATPLPGTQLHAVRFEADTSTDASHSEAFTEREVVAIFSELVGLASENAERGERP